MDAFEYRQQVQGTKIRFSENRATSTDCLLLNRLFLDGRGLFDLELQLKWLQLPLPSEISLADTSAIDKMIDTDLEVDYWRAIASLQNSTGEINEDVEATLQDKSIPELDELKVQIENMGNADEFWIMLLREIKARKARQLLRQYETQIIANRAAILRATAEKNTIDVDTPIKSMGDLLQAVQNVRHIAIERRLLKVGESDDSSGEQSAGTEGLDENEEPLIEEEPIKTDMSLEKPRYSNRVVKGFEWTKYNQKHYSNDNPPPKAIKGYRFNIFYPALDRTKTPTYKVVRGEDKETCVLIFKAPEKYRDIAFRIVNKPWDKSPRRRSGYKSRFENGSLQLHFRFKRVFYRR